MSDDYFFVSLEDVDESEVEYLLHEQQQVDDGSPRPGSFSIPPRSNAAANDLRAFFDPAFLDFVNRNYLDHPNPDVRDVARHWLNRRDWILLNVCANPNCLRRKGKRSLKGRPPVYCSSECKNAAVVRAKRNRDNPDRNERLKNFDTNNRIWPGYHGNRRFRRKSRRLWGVESLVTQTLRRQLHEDAVNGTDLAAPAVEKLFDPSWEPAHRRALDSKGPLRDELQERQSRPVAPV